MTFDSHALFAFLAITVGLLRYGTYLWSIYKGDTKPHAFSWLLWGTMTAIATFAQLELNGGPSVWAMFFVAGTCLFIAVLGVFVGVRDFTRSDWLALATALFAIPLWYITNNPIAAMALLMTIDCLSYYPTIRKSWSDPTSEPLMSYFWAGLRYFFVLFAVPDPTWQTLLYPVFLMMSDWGFGLYILWRRLALDKSLRS